MNIILSKSTSRCDDDDDGKKIVNFLLRQLTQSNFNVVFCMYANRHNQTHNNLKIVLRTHARSMMIEYAICSKRPASSAARVRCYTEAVLRLEQFVVVFILFHFVPLCRSHSWYFIIIRDPKTHVYEYS